jgi:hypothetical protein
MLPPSASRLFGRQFKSRDRGCDDGVDFFTAQSAPNAQHGR